MPFATCFCCRVKNPDGLAMRCDMMSSSSVLPKDLFAGTPTARHFGERDDLIVEDLQLENLRREAVPR
jgi:hypothetical protein